MQVREFAAAHRARAPTLVVAPDPFVALAAADGEHLLQVGQAIHDLAHAVLQQGDHAAFAGHFANFIDWRFALDATFELVAADQQLVQGNAAFVAGLTARLATLALPKLERS
jgi:hypothetical protein